MEQGCMINQMMIGKIGCGQKTITFLEEMFDETFAPPHAKIERFTEKGVSLVRMTYGYETKK